MSEFVNVPYEYGEEFLMTFQLTPDLEESMGVKFMHVKAIYRGTISDSDLEVEYSDGTLKKMHYVLEWSDHHVVEFGGERWVNDLLPFQSKKVSFKPLI
jgi:hypothetical protein